MLVPCKWSHFFLPRTICNQGSSTMNKRITDTNSDGFPLTRFVHFQGWPRWPTRFDQHGNCLQCSRLERLTVLAIRSKSTPQRVHLFGWPHPRGHSDKIKVSSGCSRRAVCSDRVRQVTQCKFIQLRLLMRPLCGVGWQAGSWTYDSLESLSCQLNMVDKTKSKFPMRFCLLEWIKSIIVRK